MSSAARAGISPASAWTRASANGWGPLLTKCCLLEDRVASDGNAVVVPWGASLTQIRDGLRLAVAARVAR